MLKQAVQRILISLLSTLILAFVSSYLMETYGRELTMSNEERDAVNAARSSINAISTRWHRSLRAEDFDQHELQVLGSVRLTDHATLDGLGGLSQIKQELRLHIVRALGKPEVFFRHRPLLPPSGVLFEGPSGTGKTSLAYAVANEAGVPLIPMTASAVQSKFVGESEKLVRSVFTLAEKLQPSIIFIDEIDGLARSRSALDQAHDYSLKTSLLQHLDHASKQQIIVIAATNHAQFLDPAFARRFPRKYTIGLPDTTARAQILRNLTCDEPEVAPHWLAEHTEGMSGADLENVYARASALRNDSLTMETLTRLEHAPLAAVLPAIAEEHWMKAAGIEFEDDGGE